VEMSEQPYGTEDLLQGLLAKYPNLLAGDQIDSVTPRRWLLIYRELGVPAEENGSDRWALDHLFLDQDAIPTLVEVKRSSDTRLRREVIGQMLDYAANGVAYWSIDQLRACFERTCGPGNSARVLAEFLRDGSDSDTYWQRVKTNLQAGKIRMLFVADQIPAEVRRIIEFLNEQMDPAEVLAIEIKQYIGEGVQALVPRIIGQTAEAQKRKAASPQIEKQWDASSFFVELETRRGASQAAAARRILDWATNRVTRVWWGRGSKYGSFVPVLAHKGRDHQLFAIWTYGSAEIYFYWYQNKPPFDSEVKRRELRNKLNQIPGVTIAESAIAKSPGIPLSALEGEAPAKQFLEVFDWVVEEIKRS
jgi:hypothetical protein